MNEWLVPILKSASVTFLNLLPYVVIGIIISEILQYIKWGKLLVQFALTIPLYVCGGGTIPLISTMLEKGLSAGAALAFFIVGPATRFTPLVAVATIMRPRFIGVMMVVLFIYAILAGICMNCFF